MKNILFLFAFGILLFSGFEGFTQCDGYNSQKIKDTVAKALSEYKISLERAYFISKDEHGYFYKTFYGGNHYGVLAYGENSALTIRLTIVDSDGILYQDTEDAVAAIEFDNDKDKSTKIIVELLEAPSNDYAKICVLIYYYKLK